MSRLTHKYKYKADNKRFVFDIQDYRKASQKLGQLEDIEDELGIDLITLFKILKASECYSKEDGECHIVGIDMNGVILMPKKFPFGECEFTVPFAEFGKTWALSRKELEKKL